MFEEKSDYGKMSLHYTVEYHAALIKMMRIRIKSSAANSLTWIKNTGACTSLKLKVFVQKKCDVFIFLMTRLTESVRGRGGGHR